MTQTSSILSDLVFNNISVTCVSVLVSMLIAFQFEQLSFHVETLCVVFEL
jgi:hypothetical protein